MPIPTFTGLGPNPQFEDVTRKINTLVNELRNLMLSLDTLNVVELDADVIIANTITASKIAAGAVGTDQIADLAIITSKILGGAVTATEIADAAIIATKIAAGAVIAGKIAANTITAAEIAANTITADRMNVTQLSAIAANLGTITAGLLQAVTITGSLIQTAASGNRLEMVSTGLNGYDSAGLKRVSVIKDYGGSAIPAFVLYDISGVESGSFRSNYASRCDLVGVSNSSLTLASSGAILNGNDVTVQTWGGNFYWGSNIVAKKGDLTSGTSVADGHNHGLSSSDYIQCYDSVGNPTVKKQWVPYAGSASHSHTII